MNFLLVFFGLVLGLIGLVWQAIRIVGRQTLTEFLAEAGVIYLAARYGLIILFGLAVAALIILFAAGGL